MSNANYWVIYDSSDTNYEKIAEGFNLGETAIINHSKFDKIKYE
jgi:hypothetical protein